LLLLFSCQDNGIVILRIVLWLLQKVHDGKRGRSGEVLELGFLALLKQVHVVIVLEYMVQLLSLLKNYGLDGVFELISLISQFFMRKVDFGVFGDECQVHIVVAVLLIVLASHELFGLL
jgi:hypothetical protein